MAVAKVTSHITEVTNSKLAPNEKVDELCRLIEESKCTLVYTGAGLSTESQIPDYRGTGGVYMRNGKPDFKSIIKKLHAAEPNLSHQLLKEMMEKRWIDHILSQNCDNLHRKSGLDQQYLSEIHGNYTVEICRSCHKHFYRPFDVTCNRTRNSRNLDEDGKEKIKLDRHTTGGNCDDCGSNLNDTIIYGGENTPSDNAYWPYNWGRLYHFLPKVELIICIGSSLSILNHYPQLWPPSAKLVIINYQKTAKDGAARFRINESCSKVLRKVVEKLNERNLSGHEESSLIPDADWLSRDNIVEDNQSEKYCEIMKDSEENWMSRSKRIMEMLY
ncbi:hypothetical protein SNEBB_008873 [Seison nebaliae]|nr:hypothetical protein SNEBB_008873 [Seison nebaliae]